MDEKPISWRAMLAKSNINILDVHDNYIFVEFTYHPKPGVFKWCKTMLEFPEEELVIPEDDPAHWYRKKLDRSDVARDILTQVLALRKELEG